MTATDVRLPLRRLSEELDSLKELPDEVQAWFESHRIAPKAVSLAHDSDGKSTEMYWLITDHNGNNDSSFRIYYDESKDRFGRECLLESEIPLVLGVFPSLLSVVEDIL